MPALPTDGETNWGRKLNEFLLVAHREDGHLRGRYEVINVKDLGAVGDGFSHPLANYFTTLEEAKAVYPHAKNLQDEIDWAAIQKAINIAGDAGGGTVFIPPSHAFYRITRYLLGRDNVTVYGTGYGSFIKNVFIPQDLSQKYVPTDPVNWYANATVFILGGYESVTPWRVDDETFYECGDEFVGEHTITLNAAADASNFAEGDTVFIRSTAQEPFSQLQHAIPFYTELNEVLSVDLPTGAVRLKYPLYDDYYAMRIAKSSGALKPAGFPIKVLKRFTVEKLRLETTFESDISVFGFGGCFECSFRNLWITHCENGIMLNVIGRCTFDDIEVRYSKRLGEIAYYCHNNLFHNIRASYAYREGLSSGNGWGCYEGAHDNTFENILLNHGKAGTRAWVIGAGRRNNLSNSEIIVHAQTNGQTIVGLLSPGWDFKPKDCVVANNKIKISGSPVGIPFAIEVDSGGPYGGGNMIWGNLIEGMPLVAPIGLSRIDKRDGLGSQQGCENNIIEGNIHTVSHVSGTMAIPIISMIVEYNNESPVGNPLSQKIIDPAIKPNLIRSNLTRQRQSSVSDYDLGIFASQEETVVRSYTVPRYSVGTHHRWLIAASGRVEVNQTHDNKHIRVYILGSQLFDIEFSPSETGSWSLCIEIAGKHVSDNIIDNNTVISRKFVHYTFQKNETISSSVVEYMHDSNVSDFVLELRTQISNPSNIVQDKVIVDKFIVTPAGEDYSYINWELLKAVWGDYPKLVYPA